MRGVAASRRRRRTRLEMIMARHSPQVQVVKPGHVLPHDHPRFLLRDGLEVSRDDLARIRPLPDLDTSGLCLVKTLSTALTCWPSRNMALRDGARTSTRTSSVAKGRTASIHCRPAPPRQTEALSSRTSRSRLLETSQPSGAPAKTSSLRACRVPNPAKRLNVVQRPKTLFEPQRSMTSRS